jgi:hypothetical protein
MMHKEDGPHREDWEHKENGPHREDWEHKDNGNADGKVLMQKYDHQV